MRKLLSRRPSPAMVVAIIAVILAVAGTATAALAKKDKKSVRKIADSEISKLAPGLSVASAGKAADTDKLGGVAPSGYVQGGGHSFFGTKLGDNPSTNNGLLNVPGFANITFSCAANGVDSTVTITNTSGSFLGDVGQDQANAGASLNPFGPSIPNGGSVNLVHTNSSNHGVTSTVLQLWNSQNGKVATVVISNVFCDYAASATTNQ